MLCIFYFRLCLPLIHGVHWVSNFELHTEENESRDFWFAFITCTAVFLLALIVHSRKYQPYSPATHTQVEVTISRGFRGSLKITLIGISRGAGGTLTLWEPSAWHNFVVTHPTYFFLFSVIGIKASSVTAENVSCVVTSMDFFDRLQEQGLKFLKGIAS